MQDFKMTSSEFIACEFCIVSSDATLMFHCIVKLPCEMVELAIGYQKQCEWLIENFHGLSWDTSNGYCITHIRRIIAQLCEVGAAFFSKDTEIVQRIKKLFQVNNV